MTDLSFEALEPEYKELWTKIIAPGGLTRPQEAEKEARAIVAIGAQVRFRLVQKRTGVPWFVTGIILTREAGSPPNFHAWLHNGDPMYDHHGDIRRTVHVPVGHPRVFPLLRATSWEDGAVDAYTIEGLIGKKDWSPAFVAWLLEKFNGWGYRQYHSIPSPYLWGGTVVQKPGKYTSDRIFDPHMMDTQIGGMALLAALMQIDPTVKFEEAVTV